MGSALRRNQDDGFSVEGAGQRFRPPFRQAAHDQGMTVMRRITRDDVTKAVGGADDVTIAEIIGTGATVDELAEAKAWLANDEPMLNTAARWQPAVFASSSISSPNSSRKTTDPGALPPAAS